MTDTIDATKPARPILGMLAAGLFAYFILVLLALHGLRPDYTPIDHMISDYAVGRFGWLMTTAFVALALGCLSLSLGLWRNGPKTVLALIGRLLLIVCCLGLMVTATFATDLETAKDTLHGTIHTISFMINILSIFLLALALSGSFGADARWKSLQVPAWALTAVLVVAFVAQVMTLHRGAPYGITNRFFVAVLVSWLMMVALRLVAVTKKAG